MFHEKTGNLHGIYLRRCFCAARATCPKQKRIQEASVSCFFLLCFGLVGFRFLSTTAEKPRFVIGSRRLSRFERPQGRAIFCPAGRSSALRRGRDAVSRISSAFAPPPSAQKKKKVSTEHAPRSLNDAQKQQQNRIPRPVPSASLHLHWNRLDHSSTWFLRKKKKVWDCFFFSELVSTLRRLLQAKYFGFFFELWVELGRQGVGLKILGLSSMPHRNVKWTYQLRSVAWDSHRYRHQRRANTTIVRRRRRGSSTHRSLVFAVTEPSD